jgi:hypothetical protein
VSEQIRLLQCLQCETLEILPDYTGSPDDDFYLGYALEQHKDPLSGTPHIGNLMKVDAVAWDDPKKRKSIEKEINDAVVVGSEKGLGDAYYYAKDQFKEDAFACWRAHNKNAVCPDYKSEKKLLKPGTSQDRKALRLPEARTKHYLCDHCPVKSIVQKKHFEKLGLL